MIMQQKKVKSNGVAKKWLDGGANLAINFKGQQKVNKMYVQSNGNKGFLNIHEKGFKSFNVDLKK